MVRERYQEDILKYVQEHVPFYQGKNYQKLQDFPVMSKPIFKREGTNCISDEYSDYTKLHVVKTSGSTGTPLVVYLNKEKRQRVIADLLVVNDNIGWNLGAHYVFLRNWTSNYQQSKVERIAKNFVAVPIGSFDDKRKEQLYNYFLHHRHSVFVGYASSVCDFMNWVKRTDKDGKAIQLKLIHCSADELTERNRKELRQTFGCPVYNRYSNEEVGLIAMMHDNSDEFQVNTASIRIELLRLDSDEYVQPGEMGRVVITDFFNHAMPLIRYDIGDLAVSCDSSDNVKSIKKICGRSSDLLTAPGGISISSVAVAAVAEVIQGIQRYQLAQQSDTKFEFRYVGSLTTTEKEELMNRLRESLGGEAEIEISEKQELLLSKTGKFKTIVNEKSIK